MSPIEIPSCVEVHLADMTCEVAYLSQLTFDEALEELDPSSWFTLEGVLPLASGLNRAALSFLRGQPSVDDGVGKAEGDMDDDGGGAERIFETAAEEGEPAGAAAGGSRGGGGRGRAAGAKGRAAAGGGRGRGRVTMNALAELLQAMDARLGRLEEERGSGPLLPVGERHGGSRGSTSRLTGPPGLGDPRRLCAPLLGGRAAGDDVDALREARALLGLGLGDVADAHAARGPRQRRMPFGSG